ncbi:Conserved_hypothetical protein [Hexamita inflata]|uniref:SNF7 family protein n=1 Tax=Hexamita inflata TaxID=28002 RepID=A0AA86UUW0_9EUKA|nr:Conserved hypothetical protein [Hexamita inflata]
MGAEMAQPPVQNPEQLQDEFKKTIQQTQNSLRKQIGAIEMEEMMLKMEVKKYAKQNDMDIVKIYGRGLATSKREKTKLTAQIAHLSTLETNLRQTLAQNKINKVYASIGQLFQVTNEQLQDPTYKAAIRSFAMQNEKLTMQMGMQDEMLDDIFNDDEIEQAADEEVSKVIQEITGQKLGNLQINNPPTAEKAIEDDTIKKAQERLAMM